MAASDDDDKKRRAWEHGLHTNDIFYNQLNFFLIFESVLLGVVGLLRAFRLKIRSVRPRKNGNKKLLPNRLVGRAKRDGARRSSRR